jgi:hypothetical protein
MRKISILVCIVTAIGGVATEVPVARAADFQSVVEEILQAQTDGPISRMNEPKKGLMIACVNQALTGLPAAKKRFVVAGETLDERQDRFGDVVMENRAEWKQKIARACAQVALQGGGEH